jgi:hypothetical protein
MRLTGVHCAQGGIHEWHKSPIVNYLDLKGLFGRIAACGFVWNREAPYGYEIDYI